MNQNMQTNNNIPGYNVQNGGMSGFYQSAGPEPPSYTPGYNEQEQPPVKKKKHTGLIILLIVLTLLLAGGGFAVAFKMNRDKEIRTCEDVIDTFFTAYQKQDLDAMYDTYHKDLRDIMKNALLETMSEQDYWEFYNNYFGGSFEISYSFTKHKKVADEDLKTLLDDISNVYGVSLSVKDAYVFKTVEEYSGPNGVQKQEETIVLAESGGEWVIIAASVDAILENSVTTAEPATTEQDILTPDEPLYSEPVTTEDVAGNISTEDSSITTESSSTGQAGAYDWNTMPFTYNGSSYELLSLTYKDIEAMGFTVEDDVLSEQIPAGERSSIEMAKNGDSYVYIKFGNPSDAPKAARECVITEIDFSYDGYWNVYDASLPNGITFGMSCKEVTSIMGSPADYYESEDKSYISIKYDKDCGREFPNEIELNFLDNQLTEIFLEYSF